MDNTAGAGSNKSKMNEVSPPPVAVTEASEDTRHGFVRSRRIGLRWRFVDIT